MKMNATISNGLFLLIFGTSMVGKSEPFSKKNYPSLQLRSPPPKRIHQQKSSNNNNNSSNKSLSQQKNAIPQNFCLTHVFCVETNRTQLMANWWFGIPGVPLREEMRYFGANHQSNMMPLKRIYIYIDSRNQWEISPCRLSLNFRKNTMGFQPLCRCILWM